MQYKHLLNWQIDVLHFGTQTFINMVFFSTRILYPDASPQNASLENVFFIQAVLRLSGKLFSDLVPYSSSARSWLAKYFLTWCRFGVWRNGVPTSFFVGVIFLIIPLHFIAWELHQPKVVWIVVTPTDGYQGRIQAGAWRGYIPPPILLSMGCQW